jgi:hypothetical protein
MDIFKRVKKKTGGVKDETKFSFTHSYSSQDGLATHYSSGSLHRKHHDNISLSSKTSRKGDLEIENDNQSFIENIDDALQTVLVRWTRHRKLLV